MAVEIERPQVVSCPPHYWLIERVARHTQHWTCRRCGVQEIHETAWKLPARWADHRTSQQKA
jgi:hypothetical protein